MPGVKGVTPKGFVPFKKGEGPRVDWEKVKRERRERKQRESEAAHALALINGITEGGELIKWRKVPREEWLYKDFKEQFLKGRRTFGQEELIKMWEGVPGNQERQIRRYFQNAFVYVDRQCYLAKMLVETQLFDSASPEFIARMNNLRVASCLERMAVIEGVLQSGRVTDSILEEVKVLNEDGNPTRKKELKFVDKERPLKVREVALLEQRLEEKEKLLRLLTEQSTDIKKQSVDVDVECRLQKVVQSSLRVNDPEYRMLEAIEQGQPVNRNSQAINRMIDVTQEATVIKPEDNDNGFDGTQTD